VDFRAYVENRGHDAKSAHAKLAAPEEAVPYFVMTYHLLDDYINRRVPLREEHLKLAAEAHARGELVLGGAFADPPDKALTIFRSADRSVPENFARNDPYVTNGLVVEWEVRPWTVVIGASEQAPT
jgi:uncharacterized protein